ncbi:MAG TPA: enoyl-CoA hydratase [Bacteroidetes bacterium]|nr:enoyl-CoA hydratase [Bacteroidota bacterium]
MEFKKLLVNIEDNIAIVTINRPNALNALNKDVFDDLDLFFTEYALNNKDIKGVIITGAGGKAFAAGADITEFIGMSVEEGSRLSRRGMEVFFKIENFPKPVIAAINGFSLGGGNELAMACHIRVAGSKAKFGQPEENLGLITGYGGTQRLPILIGRAKAMELLLTGDMIGADEAKELGLVNHVVEQGDELKKSIEILKKIISKSPFAIAKMIEAVNAGYDKDRYEVEIKNFGETIGSHDGQEGANAFLNKRKPDFKGY